MKNLIVLLAMIFSQTTFARSVFVEVPHSDPNYPIFETLIKEDNIPMNLKLDETTVRCLVGDYGGSSLKISVADLKYYAVFRHTT